MTATWFAAAVRLGSTPGGAAELLRRADEADLGGEAGRAASLRAAAARGDAEREAREDAERPATPSRPGLQQVDVERVVRQFGVADEQVRRDHVVSHVLAALSAMPEAGDLVFFGGTALSRTYLPALRLSEDVDLITTADRRSTAERIETAVARALRRTHGGVEWRPRLAAVRDAEPAVVVVAGGLTVRVQLLAAAGYPPWPTRTVRLIQRYRDVAAAELATYTPQAFAASKLVAWLDRAAPRDLYDLWGLARAAYVDEEAVRLFAAYGPTGGPPAEWMFRDGPRPEQWQDALGHQGQVAVGAAEALDVVGRSWLHPTSVG